LQLQDLCQEGLSLQHGSSSSLPSLQHCLKLPCS
jgi:hypothetical protein